MPCALVFALERAARSMPAKIAMMAMTTNSSMRVKPSRVSLIGGCMDHRWMEIGTSSMDKIVEEGSIHVKLHTKKPPLVGRL